MDTDNWNLEDAENAYGINAWAFDYHWVSSTGEVCVSYPNPGGTVTQVGPSLVEIVDRIRQENPGIRPPMRLRFPHLIAYRVKKLNNCFQDALNRRDYPKPYRAVYPVKVNQQQKVVETILDAGAEYHHGLEVGSKPELVLALAKLKDDKALLVCNGKKDEEYIRLAFAGLRAGLHVIIVIESEDEVSKIANYSKLTGIKPHLGVRVRLRKELEGKQMKTGHPSFFGLDARDLVKVLKQLKEEELLEQLEMLHYHQSTQIQNLNAIRESVREACRFYIGLKQLGAPMGHLDVGGGLAVDYDASRSSAHSSKDYNTADYADAIVDEIAETMADAEIEPPVITSESGRAVVAPGAMLVMPVIDCETVLAGPPDPDYHSTDDLVRKLLDLHESLENDHLSHCISSAIGLIEHARTDFESGYMNLPDLAQAEALYGEIVRDAVRKAESTPNLVPPEIEKIHHLAGHFYTISFSIFQSVPDSWGIQQVFPVMPIHRLKEEPEFEASLVDLTCDHDGSIDEFGCSTGKPRQTLRLHKFHKDQEYLLGIFLLGAYQEVLGDRHNLFGQTHLVDVYVEQNGDFDIELNDGESAEDVLVSAHFKLKDLADGFAEFAADAKDPATNPDLPSAIEIFNEALKHYPYLAHDDGAETKPADDESDEDNEADSPESPQ